MNRKAVAVKRTYPPMEDVEPKAATAKGGSGGLSQNARQALNVLTTAHQKKKKKKDQAKLTKRVAALNEGKAKKAKRRKGKQSSSSSTDSDVSNDSLSSSSDSDSDTSSGNLLTKKADSKKKKVMKKVEDEPIEGDSNTLGGIKHTRKWK